MHRFVWRPDSCAIQLRVDRANIRQELMQLILTAGKGMPQVPGAERYRSMN